MWLLLKNTSCTLAILSLQHFAKFQYLHFIWIKRIESTKFPVARGACPFVSLVWKFLWWNRFVYCWRNLSVLWHHFIGLFSLIQYNFRSCTTSSHSIIVRLLKRVYRSAYSYSIIELLFHCIQNTIIHHFDSRTTNTKMDNFHKKWNGIIFNSHLFRIYIWYDFAHKHTINVLLGCNYICATFFRCHIGLGKCLLLN